MATGEREKALYWVGPTDSAGTPTEWLSGINAADLDSFTINELSDEDYQRALASGFYQKSKPKGHTEPAAAAADAPAEEGEG